jgi:hypothetical protein
MSIPSCSLYTPVSGWRRMPYPEVMGPRTGRVNFEERREGRPVCRPTLVRQVVEELRWTRRPLEHMDPVRLMCVTGSIILGADLHHTRFVDETPRAMSGGAVHWRTSRLAVWLVRSIGTNGLRGLPEVTCIREGLADTLPARSTATRRVGADDLCDCRTADGPCGPATWENDECAPFWAHTNCPDGPCGHSVTGTPDGLRKMRDPSVIPWLSSTLSCAA